MRVLVTGDAGMIGRDVASALCDRGDTVLGFDKSRGEDVLNPRALEQAGVGCDAVVHCAAIKNDSRGTPAEIFATNVTGTWNTLRAAEHAGAVRFVYLSSAQVFGVFDPAGRPAYLPVDDDHPRNASRPYGLSKRFGEDLCAALTSRTEMTTVALRPVAVYDEPTYEWARRQGPALSSRPWQDRSFVDLRDVTSAILLALDRTASVGAGLTLCADYPTPACEGEPAANAFDTSAATRVLGWRPAHHWQDVTEASANPEPKAAERLRPKERGSWSS